MKPNANKIIITILASLAVLLLLPYRELIATFFANIKNLGPTHTSDEQTSGLIALGFLCATFIAIFRILMNNKNN